MDSNLHGAHALLATPFTSDGEIDIKSLRNLVEHMVESGVNGVIPLGTTGEFFNLTSSEWAAVARQVVKDVNGRLAVTVGVGALSTAQTIEHACFAESLGVDCIMVPPPIYFTSSPSAQLRHFVDVANSTSVPVMVYDGAGGIPVPASVIAEAASKAANIEYAKVALPDPGRVSTLVAETQSVAVLAGDDAALLSSLANGAQGSAIATTMIMPREVISIHDAMARGDVPSATELYARHLAPAVLSTSVPKTDFIALLKEVLHAMGIIETAKVRTPLLDVTPEVRERLISSMQQIGVLPM